MNNNNHTPHVQSFALTDKGRRPNNEDYVTTFEPTETKERQLSGCIYIVADGVGGAAIGERASKFASEKVLYEYLKNQDVEPAIRLKRAISRANTEIFEYAEQNNIRMATTMTIAVILGNRLIAANVGDSRVYLIRGGEVKQVTQDHNVVGELVRSGAMTEAEAIKSKAKNKLTRSIGGSDEVQADTFELPLQPDDRILLCSDGLTRYALKEDIVRLAASGSPKQIVTDAIEFAKKRGHGGADNISVIAVAYEPSQTMVAKPVGTRPEEEWEIRATELEKAEPKKQMVLVLPVVIAMIVIGLAAIGGGVAFMFGDQIMAYLQPQTATPVTAQVVDTATLTPSPTSLPTATETSVPTVTATETVTATTTSTGEPTATETATNTPTPTNTPVLISCLYTVASGDTLFGIADRFGIGGKNYRNISCVASTDNPSCDVHNPGSIQAGWQIVIPGVVQDVCTLNGGTPQP